MTVSSPLSAVIRWSEALQFSYFFPHKISYLNCSSLIKFIPRRLTDFFFFFAAPCMTTALPGLPPAVAVSYLYVFLLCAGMSCPLKGGTQIPFSQLPFPSFLISASFFLFVHRRTAYGTNIFRGLRQFCPKKDEYIEPEGLRIEPLGSRGGGFLRRDSEPFPPARGSGSAVSRAEPQPKLNLVHFSSKNMASGDYK